jgi:hypothetical protein
MRLLGQITRMGKGKGNVTEHNTLKACWGMEV